MDAFFQNFTLALTIYPAFGIVLTLILGAIVGSFLNVVNYRLPIMMQREDEQACEAYIASRHDIESFKNTGLTEDSVIEKYESQPKFNLAYPASSCPHCSHKIRAWENIPIISYLLLKGRCSQCKTPISIEYPLVELLCALLTLGCFLTFGATLQCLAAMLLCWCFLSLSMIDIKTQLLPDNMTLPFIWLGLIVNYFGFFTDFHSAFWGAIAGYLSLWMVYWVFKLTTGKEGMGYGDFKLLSLIGAWLGWQYLPLVILMSSVVGVIIGIIMLSLKGLKLSTQIPFGPYLAISGWIMLMWGEILYQHYLNWII